MALTDIQCRNAKPKDKPYKLFDSEGLYLYVPASGKKVWRFKYRFNTKEGLITIDKYQNLNLKEARKVRNSFISELAKGTDPAAAKKQRKQPTGKTFAEVAQEWIAFKSLPGTKRCWKPTHTQAVTKSFKNDIYPSLGGKVISAITPQDIDDLTNPIVSRGALEVAERALSRLNAVFRFAAHKGYSNSNPAAGKGEYLPTKAVQHMAHLTLEQLPEFLRTQETYQGDFVCKSAVMFVLLTHVRTDELRFAQWSEIDLDAALWSIPPERMKMNIAQTIPLSTQALAILNSLKPITGNGKHVFASLVKTGQPISENGMLSVIYRMGYKGKTTIHGLRSTFSTIANETLKFRSDVVEASLAHKVKDPVREAYNHATYLDERTVNAQVWADYLAMLHNSVISIRTSDYKTA
jgi:integrase